jgi:hypothetical protein
MQKSPRRNAALCAYSTKQNRLLKIIRAIMKLNQYNVITMPVIKKY